MGISIQCPLEDVRAHARVWGQHRVELWFSQPDDDADPNWDAQPFLYMHMGTLDEVHHFTIFDFNGRPLEVPNHWHGYLVEGMVYDARRPF